MEVNNPASRLYSILNELKVNPSPNRSTQSVLAEVVGVSDNPIAVMHALIQLHSLLAEVVRTAKATGSIPGASLARYLPQIENALVLTNLDAPWHNYRERITPDCLVILDIAANHERVTQDRRPLDEEIEALRNSLDELFDFTERTNLDPEFRRFLLEQVEGIRRCLAEYRIAGPQGFARYLETFIGQVARYSADLKREATSNPGAMSRFKAVLLQVKRFVAFSDSGIKFLQQVDETCANGMTLLGDLTDGADPVVPEVGGLNDSA